MLIILSVHLFAGSGDLAAILDAVHDVVSWKKLGLKLNIYKATLEKIDSNKRGDIDECKSDMFDCWLRWVDGVTEQTCTWRCLAAALRAVDQEPTAKKIEETYGKKTL